MKKIIYGVLIGFVIAIVIISVGAKTNGAPILTYVYSNSMEPLIKVNDAFLVWPDKRPEIGDIIMFRPMVLKAPYITHRIIAIGEKGYITKGDNSPYQDQGSGEPEVTRDRIVGKVVTMNGQPLIIPGLGNISARIQSQLGSYSRFMSVIFLVLGILSVFMGKGSKVKKHKPHNRWRLRHIYQAIIIISAFTIMLSIYLGSRVSQFTYLVSEYPGSTGDQIEVNKPDQLIMKIRNKGIVPVWTIITGVDPLSVLEAPQYLWIRSEGSVILDVTPHSQIGLYQGYIQIYNYPILLPRTWVIYLHRSSPAIAILATGLTMALWFKIFFVLLNHVHGFENWIPLRAIKDKILRRRMKRARAKLLGRRRVR